MPVRSLRRLAAAGAPALCLALALSGAVPAGPGRPLPPIVFVSRQPVPDDAGAVPGLGPHHRAYRNGGRLMLREADGRVRELPAGDRTFDVSDPAVAPDGRRVAFAMAQRRKLRRVGDPPPPGGVPLHARWRIRVLDLATGELSDPWRGARDSIPADDLDPCWIGDSLIAFASTQGDWRSQYANVPATNLWLAKLGPGTPTWRLTSERNGAEEPAWDARNGRLLYARWWYNRWRASDDPPGVVAAHDRVDTTAVANLWQVVSVRPDGGDLRIEASGLVDRVASAGYQPALLRDGSVVAVAASNPGLSPAAGLRALHRFAPRLGRATRVAGAAIDEAVGYGSARGLAAPAACAPAGLPDGRMLFSWLPGARGDFGLAVARADGRDAAMLLDLPDAHELDAAPVVARPAERRSPRVANPAHEAPWPPTLEDVRAPRTTFRFFDRDVFAGSGARAGLGDAPPRTPNARVRFWATVASATSAHGDTAVLVLEAPVAPDGSVDARLPAGVPMFEQVVDAAGRVLRSASGPAHVAGLNAGSPVGEARCVGCHVGHSTIRVAAGR